MTATNNQKTAIILAILTAAPAWLFAKNQSRIYTVNIANVTDNCGDNSLRLSGTQAEVIEDESGIVVNLSKLPALRGALDSKGKLRLAAKQSENRFSANGREFKGTLQLVLIIEHFKNNKPQCTQSFSVNGKRKL